jgi:hypothetical protein
MASEFLLSAASVIGSNPRRIQPFVTLKPKFSAIVLTGFFSQYLFQTKIQGTLLSKVPSLS